MYVGHPFLALIHLLVSALALLITAYVVPGFRVKNFGHAVIAAMVIGLVSFFLRTFLLFLTLPLNILTLGLFTFVVDAIILKICAALLRGFDITSWWAAIFGAILLSIVNVVLHWILV